MADYILSCCTPADLSAEHVQERDIHYICFHYYLDGEHFFDDLGQSMPFDEFYARLAGGAETRTSQINAEEFIAYFKPFLEQGKDVLHISLSSGISGVYNSAVLAACELQEQFPEREIRIIDSLGASGGYGFLVDKLADLRDEGLSLDELAVWAEEHKRDINHWFFSGDLTFYIKGGRISKLAGVFGTILQICPVLNVDYEGRLIPREKVRSKNKAIRRLCELMAENALDGEQYSDKCYITYSACEEDAKSLAAMIEERFKQLKGRVLLNSVGTTIGSHTGPGTVALFFMGKRREN